MHFTCRWWWWWWSFWSLLIANVVFTIEIHFQGFLIDHILVCVRACVCVKYGKIFDSFLVWQRFFSSKINVFTNNIWRQKTKTIRKINFRVNEKEIINAMCVCVCVVKIYITEQMTYYIWFRFVKMSQKIIKRERERERTNNILFLFPPRANVRGGGKKKKYQITN